MKDSRTHVLTRAELQDLTGIKGPGGRFVASLLYKALNLDGFNRIQGKYSRLSGAPFAASVLDEIGVRYHIPEHQMDRIPAEGAFIIVCNHPFGSLDGLILETLVGSRRPDLKVLTTFMLTLIPGLSEGFIPVDNFSSGAARSLNGLRAALEHLAGGHPLALFPAGEVSTWQKEKTRTALGKGRIVEDIPWADSVVKLVKNSGLPVIPLFFQGGNSRLFHTLGRIHPRLRTVRLIHELFNKRGTHVKVRIGLPITPQEIAKFEDTEAFGQYLRNVTYALEASCIETPKRADVMHQEPVMDPVDPELVQKELAAIQKNVLFEVGDYRCYLASPQEIPNALLEIARLREITFRTVGEGTGTEKDTDIYDTYYRHLILWNLKDQKIAGAYRIGVGPEVLARPEGAKGFYTASLLEFREGLNAYLPKTMELGRSFIVGDYRKEVLPLKLLLSGILTAGAHLPGMEYTMGPVSVSSDVPTFYKSLIYHYFLKNHSVENASDIVRPTTPFTPDFLRVNPDQLLAGCKNVDEFDRLLSYISSGTVRLPVLFRKYASLGAKYLAFNIDTDFNTLDAFIIQWLGDMPENSFNSFARFLTPEKLEEIKSRLNR